MIQILHIQTFPTIVFHSRVIAFAVIIIYACQLHVRNLLNKDIWTNLCTYPINCPETFYVGVEMQYWLGNLRCTHVMRFSIKRRSHDWERKRHVPYRGTFALLANITDVLTRWNASSIKERLFFDGKVPIQLG